jgi:LemA protein
VTTIVYVVIAVVVLLVLWYIVTNNSLIRARNKVDEAWSGIDVQLKRRSELVPNLVESVKGYATHERSVLEEVTRLRNAAREVPVDDVAGRAQAERALSAAIGKLVALAEDYPDLKASANFLKLQHELSQLEDELQMARRYYNGTVRNQNVLVQSFPGNLVAGLFGFAPRDYFELSDAAQRDVPQVALPGRTR